MLDFGISLGSHTQAQGLDTGVWTVGATIFVPPETRLFLCSSRRSGA